MMLAGIGLLLSVGDREGGDREEHNYVRYRLYLDLCICREEKLTHTME